MSSIESSSLHLSFPLTGIFSKLKADEDVNEPGLRNELSGSTLRADLWERERQGRVRRQLELDFLASSHRRLSPTLSNKRQDRLTSQQLDSERPEEGFSQERLRRP